MQFGIPRTSARRRGRRADRGATLVEYALGISLLCVASIGGINAVQSSLEDNIEQHGATAGAPDLPDAGIPTTTATTTTPTTASPPTSAPSTVSATATAEATRVGAESGNKWDPAVDISARDASNQRLRGVTITVTWSYTVGGVTTTTPPATCDVPSTGVCTFQLNDLRSQGANCTPSVTYTVTSITSSSQTIQYTPGSLTGTITGPAAC